MSKGRLGLAALPYNVELMKRFSDDVGCEQHCEA